MLHDTVNILEEADVAQLVDLVVADGLDAQLFPDILQVVGGCGQRGDPGSRETDLGCGSKFLDQVRVSGPLALRQNLDQMILVMIVQVMHRVRIIPVNTEILCRRF